MGFLSDQQLAFDKVKQLHRNSDVDQSPLALHHTLGTLPNQASPGSHNHDGKTSRKIHFDDLEGGWMNIDGGLADAIFGGLPSFDGGSV